ncbi:hypothetical protein DERF_008235 [Dermatophagoides farinae]|uniref:Uncharacterized protein n=1 Tax=Dermatophagoides farinae TaxID=6954 RepID=A0A922L440_DERFA|nr:hypothetical protein DERF_008235 [Dermatophagoides farinae]
MNVYHTHRSIVFSTNASSSSSSPLYNILLISRTLLAYIRKCVFDSSSIDFFPVRLVKASNYS